MRRGILTGLSVDDVLEILEDASSHPVPDPVRVAVRDWGRDLDWVTAQPALVLNGLRSERAQELRDLLEEEGMPHENSEDGAIVLTGSSVVGRNGAPPPALELLRERGWLVREDRGSSLELRSEKRE